MPVLPRFLVLRDKEIIAEVDDIASYDERGRTSGVWLVGLTYWDRKQKKWVKKGKRGPVKGREPVPAQNIPGTDDWSTGEIDKLVGNFYKHTRDEFIKREAENEGVEVDDPIVGLYLWTERDELEYIEAVKLACAFGYPVRKEVLAQLEATPDSP